MKDAGLLKTRKEGTKIYYYFDPDMKTIHASGLIPLKGAKHIYCSREEWNHA